MASRHFTLDDRQQIYEGICNGLSIRTIAHNLGVSPSTVSRELEKHRILDQNGSFKKNGASCERVLKAPWICNGCKNFAENIVILQLVLKVLMKLLYTKPEKRFVLEVMG